MADECQEFVKAYEQCFMTVPLKTGTRRAFVLTGWDKSSGQVLGRIVSPSYKEKSLGYDANWVRLQAVPIVPASGYYNVDMYGVGNVAMYMRIGTDRQYRKGLCAESRIITTSIESSPYFHGRYKAIKTEAVGSSAFDNRVLAHHLSIGNGRSFQSLRAAVDKVASGEAHSVAFSRFFCTSLVRGLIYPAILYNNEVVGVYHEGRIECLDSVLHLRDFFIKKWGVDMRLLAGYGDK